MMVKKTFANKMENFH